MENHMTSSYYNGICECERRDGVRGQSARAWVNYARESDGSTGRGYSPSGESLAHTSIRLGSRITEYPLSIPQLQLAL